jgi:phenylalanyl-tRNA synthetase beta chain
VRAETTEVLLEAANFEPIGILRSSERLRLRTEGSNRWEKGVDPYLAEQAAKLATELVVELASARWVGHADVQEGLPAPPVVSLRPERTSALVGLEVASDEQRGILTRLGFPVADDWTVSVPTWRARDVTREVDLVEEVARFELERVPYTLPARRVMFGRLSQEQRLRRLVEDVLVGCGFSEAYTASLVAADPEPGALRLPEPLSEEHALLRTTLREGLVASAVRNVNAGWPPPIRLFELARVYLPAPGEPLPNERWRVAGVAGGGFADAKGAVEAILAGLKLDLAFEPDGAGAARVGEGRVERLRDARLEGDWGFFELDLGSLFAAVPERIVYEDVITYPALKQDLAFVVDEGVPAGALVAAAREAAGPELRELRVFDVYHGEQIPPGKKSLAFAASFQSPERTLTDEDAERLRRRIVAALRERFGAELRA